MEYPGIYVADYDHHTITVHLHQPAGPGTKWQIETEIHKGTQLVGKRRADTENRWDDYLEARKAGLDEGRRRIRNLPKSAA